MAVTYEYDTFASATPADTNLATLLTLAAGEELIQSEVICANLSVDDLTIRVGVGTGGAPDVYFAYNFPLTANLYVRIFIPGLGSENKVFVRSSSADEIAFSISGLKKTTT